MQLVPGHYVLAVSGGVDSMVLFDLLHKRPGVTLTVAHFNHGIRPDAHLDKQLVENIAKQAGVSFVHTKGNLGPEASEAQARAARYEFLQKVKAASGARAIITAHHQDDLIETALLNILRGTGRRGLSSLKSTDGIIRPLLSYPKQRIRDYAAANRLAWREDSTNTDTRYKRNYVRHELVPRLTEGQREQLRILLEDIAQLNEQIDSELATLLHVQPAVDSIDRKWFIMLPHSVAREVVHHWLGRHEVPQVDRRRLEQLVVTLKTGQANTTHHISKKHSLELTKDRVRIKNNAKTIA